MSAAVLREAAALMRERAAVGSPSFWSAAFVTNAFMAHPHVDVYADGVPETVARGAEHVASWDPAVALAVADWLDATAGDHESDSGNPSVDAFFTSFDTAADVAALAVARVYLGTTP